MNNQYAILVGSDTFPDEEKLNNLHCPIKDVEGLSEVLISPQRGAFTSVNVLKNEPFYKVIREIQRTFNKAGKNDLVLLYYSGHGKLNRAGKLHLTTVDTILEELESTSISVSRIREFIDVSSCRKVVIILDCCFGGAVGKIFTKGSVEDQLQASGGQGTYIMTASTEIQVAEEKEGDSYSVFTKNLINGLKTGEADLNGDGKITLDELYEYVYRNVSLESPQKPTKWGIDLRGEIVLAKSGKNPRSDRRVKIRKILMQWASGDSIPDNILSEALNILKLPIDQLSEAQISFDDLLEKVLPGDLGPGEFVQKWSYLESASGFRKHVPNYSEPPEYETVREEREHQADMDVMVEEDHNEKIKSGTKPLTKKEYIKTENAGKTEPAESSNRKIPDASLGMITPVKVKILVRNWILYSVIANLIAWSIKSILFI